MQIYKYINYVHKFFSVNRHAAKILNGSASSQLKSPMRSGPYKTVVAIKAYLSCSLSISFVYMYNIRNELYVITDAAAVAYYASKTSHTGYEMEKKKRREKEMCRLKRGV